MNWIVDASVVDDNQLRDRRSHNRQPHDRRLPDFRLQGRMTGLVVPTLFLAIVCGSVAPSHASLLDWLFPNRSRRAQPQVVAMVPVGGNGVPTSPIASSGAMATYGYPGIGTAPVNWSAGSPYSAQASVVGGDMPQSQVIKPPDIKSPDMPRRPHIGRFGRVYQ